MPEKNKVSVSPKGVFEKKKESRTIENLGSHENVIYTWVSFFIRKEDGL
jgi:hypothetical protein